MISSADLRGQRASTFETMKELVERADAEKRDMTAEEASQWAALDAEMNKLDEKIERALKMEREPANTADLDREERARLERHGPIQGPSDPEERKAAHSAAFRKWMLGGMGYLDPEERNLMMRSMSTVSDAEQRALQTVNMTGAGFFVPETFERSVDQAMAFFGGMREAASVFTTADGGDFIFPTSNDTTNTGRILSESAAVTETDPTVGRVIMKAYTYSSDLVRVSYQMLQDSAFDLNGWLAGLLAERIGRIQNTHFTTGTGANQPSGLAQDATSGVTAAAVGAITADELIDLQHAVNIAYRGRPSTRWMFHDLTLREIRQLKDGNGQYLFRPGLTAGEPNVLLGYPYTINNDVAQLATGQRTVFFGDFSKYKIRDVRGFTLLRLEERYADNLEVGFIGFSRADGALLDSGSNPIQCITQA